MNTVELIKTDENHYTIGENTVEFIENKIIYVIASGELNHEVAILFETLHYKFLQLAENKISYLIDASKSGKISPKAIKILKNLIFQPQVDKMAIYGINAVTRVIAAFVVGLSPQKNHQLFITKDEASSWLNLQE